jgi:hypothetical protein
VLQGTRVEHHICTAMMATRKQCTHLRKRTVCLNSAAPAPHNSVSYCILPTNIKINHNIIAQKIDQIHNFEVHHPRCVWNKSNCKVYAYIVKHNYVLGGMLFTIRKAHLHVSATNFGHHQVVQRKLIRYTCICRGCINACISD